jgi:HK97 family phage prohead protease
MAGKTEVRTFRSGSLRAMSQGDEGSMVISGRALSYNVLSADLGGFKERLQPGCFARHLKTAPDVLCRREHETGFLLGRTKNGTLTLQDGPDGLDFRCIIDPADPIAVSTHAAIRSGLIDGMSFAFGVDGDDGDAFDSAVDERGQRFTRRTIKSALLLDVAPVAAPAYPQGTSVSARSRVADYDTSRVAVPPQRTVSAPLKMTLSDVRRLSRETGHSFEDIVFGYSPKISEDRWLKMKLEAIGDVVMRAKKDTEDDLEDSDSDWDERTHERAAAKHRFVAQHSSLDDAIKHYNAADAHQKAAENFNRTNSRAARRASKKTMPESMVS